MGWTIQAPAPSNRESFVFSISSKLAVWCDKPPQWVMVAPFMEVQWPGCEADHSSAYSGEVKKELNCTTPAVFLHGVYTDSFTTSTYTIQGV